MGVRLVTTHRSERIADLVREATARIIASELRDPRVGFVTVTEVRLSADLKNARVFVAVHETQRAGQCIDALNRAAPFLRRRLAGQVQLRYVPALRFEHDTAMERGTRVEEILRRLQDDESGGDET